MAKYTCEHSGIEFEIKNKGVTDWRVQCESEEIFEDLLKYVDCYNLIYEFFKGNVDKTVLWFKTPNPSLGNIAPMEMVVCGRAHKLLKFIQDRLDGVSP